MGCKSVVPTAAAVILLAGCQADFLPVDDAGRITATPPPTTSVTVPPKGHGRGACDAASLQYLVGKSRLQIPVAADITKRRVVCSTCELTGPPDPKRTTFLYDQRSGLVTKVICQ
jgi:hypothetical protein